MAVMRCRVSFIDSDGTEHAVEVEAETLFDAVGLAIARFHAAPLRRSSHPSQAEGTAKNSPHPTDRHGVRISLNVRVIGDKRRLSARTQLLPGQLSLAQALDRAKHTLQTHSYWWPRPEFGLRR